MISTITGPFHQLVVLFLLQRSAAVLSNKTSVSHFSCLDYFASNAFWGHVLAAAEVIRTPAIPLLRST